MKSISILLSIVVIILLLNVFISGFIQSSANSMLSILTRTKEAMSAGDNKAVTEEIRRLRKEWEADESRWEACIDHNEVDKIDTLLTRMEAMAATGTLDTMLPELQELEFFLSHVNDKNKLKVENIF